MCGYTHSALGTRAGGRLARVDSAASDVGRNASAEWRHLCGDRPYGLHCAAHGRDPVQLLLADQPIAAALPLAQ